MDFTVIGSGPGAARELSAALDRGEILLAAYFSSFCSVFAWEARMATVVLTDRRVGIAKDRLFGKPRLDRTVALDAIDQLKYGAMYGTGPAWVLQFFDQDKTLWSIQFSHGDECEQFARELGRARSAAAEDPIEAFFQEAQRRSSGATAGTQLAVDLYAFVRPQEAPHRFYDILVAAPHYGFTVLDGATNMILLEKV